MRTTLQARRPPRRLRVELLRRRPRARTNEDRTIQAVSEVEPATSGDLTLTTGDAPSLRITAGENVIDELTVGLSGSGGVTLAGRAGRQRVHLDGSGGYDARKLDSTDDEVTVSGSGTADVQVSGRLDAVVEGSGSITYGGGASVHERVDGSGSVEER